MSALWRLWSRLRPTKLLNQFFLGGLAWRRSQSYSIIRQVLQERLTYLDARALADLHIATLAVKEHNLPGLLIETGCALGGSALVMASAKDVDRPFFIYDVFDMIPSPSARDGEDVYARYSTIAAGQAKGIGGDLYYGYQKSLQEQVQQTFERYKLPVDANNIHLIKGLYEDVLNPQQPIALAHIDCDWYESVMVCLQRIEPHLVPGGKLIIDDYWHWSGCRTAVDEYFANKRHLYTFTSHARLHITRKLSA